MRRVNEAVRAVVADGIGELGDPRIGILTVTGVDVSPDLHDARIYVSVFGGPKKKRAALAALESARNLLQSRVAQRAAHEANAPARVRIRSVGRARRAHGEAHRRARPG